MRGFLELLGMVAVLVIICLFLGNIDHPERIGQWFGEIINGFKGVVK